VHGPSTPVAALKHTKGVCCVAPPSPGIVAVPLAPIAKRIALVESFTTNPPPGGAVTSTSAAMPSAGQSARTAIARAHFFIVASVA
jgi:hypothetical protein